jgi:SAM-dependent methyltransferase
MGDRIHPEFNQYASNYEAVINGYIGFFGQPQEFYTRAKANYLRHILDAKGGTETLDVLDVGCGHGLIHPYLSGTSYRLTGIDVAEDAIEIAHQRNPHVDYDVYDGSRLPYADETFDVLFTICVMHHVAVDQRDTFVSEARRVLRPGGTFVVFEHNKLNPLVQWIVARIPFDRNAVLLTSWHTQKLVRAAGFREIDCRYILFFPFEAAALRKVEGYLGLAAVGRAVLRHCHQVTFLRGPSAVLQIASPPHGETAAGRSRSGSVTDDPSDRRPRRSQSVPSPTRRCPEPCWY